MSALHIYYQPFTHTDILKTHSNQQRKMAPFKVFYNLCIVVPQPCGQAASVAASALSASLQFTMDQFSICVQHCAMREVTCTGAAFPHFV